jgi:hypothetical protein
MRVSLVVAVLSLCVGARAAAPPLASLDVDVDAATAQLAHAALFEDVAIGIDGHTSDSARAWRVVFAAPDAAARFQDIARHGTTVAKVYAAMGLRTHDRAAYHALITELVSDRSTVAMRTGCLGRHMTVRELVVSDDPDAVRLADGEPLSAWFARHNSGALDVVGGGYTASFSSR